MFDNDLGHGNSRREFPPFYLKSLCAPAHIRPTIITQNEMCFGEDVDRFCELIFFSSHEIL